MLDYLYTTQYQMGGILSISLGELALNRYESQPISFDKTKWTTEFDKTCFSFVVDHTLDFYMYQSYDMRNLYASLLLQDVSLIKTTIIIHMLYICAFKGRKIWSSFTRSLSTWEFLKSMCCLTAMYALTCKHRHSVP